MARRITPAVETEAPKSGGNDFFSALNSTKVETATKATKDKISVLTPENDLRQNVDEYVEWKNREKEAKAEKESRETSILEYAEKIRDDEGFNGNYQKSYRVAGINSVVTVVSADKFSKIRDEDIPQIKELLGKRVDEFIQTKPKVSLRGEIFTDEKLQNELMKLIPKERFGEFFVSTADTTVTEGYDKKVYTLSRKIVEALRQLIKQAKPSVR
jgi:uncharacterized membrane protein YheB (UPF0754 family)